MILHCYYAFGAIVADVPDGADFRTKRAVSDGNQRWLAKLASISDKATQDRPMLAAVPPSEPE